MRSLQLVVVAVRHSAARSVRRLVVLSTVAGLSLLLAACGSRSTEISGSAVAEVAGTQLTMQAYHHWMYVFAKTNDAGDPSQPVIVPTDPPRFSRCIANARKQIPNIASVSDQELESDCRQLFTSLSSEVMDFLIQAYWIEADAAHQHVSVTQAQLFQAFSTAKALYYPTEAKFQAFLSKTGQTSQDLLFRFRINALFTKLLAKHSTPITPAQIRAYYDAHASQSGTPETRNVRIVLTRTRAQAVAAKAALANGQSWNAVATRYSMPGSATVQGTYLVGLRNGQGDAVFDRAVFSAAPNRLLGPVQGRSGYYVFDVTGITPAKPESLAAATPAIRQTLANNEQTNATNAVNRSDRAHWLAETRCRAPYAMDDCTGYKASETSS